MKQDVTPYEDISVSYSCNCHVWLLFWTAETRRSSQTSLWTPETATGGRTVHFVGCNVSVQTGKASVFQNVNIPYQSSWVTLWAKCWVVPCLKWLTVAKWVVKAQGWGLVKRVYSGLVWGHVLPTQKAPNMLDLELNHTIWSCTLFQLKQAISAHFSTMLKKRALKKTIANEFI